MHCGPGQRSIFLTPAHPAAGNVAPVETAAVGAEVTQAVPEPVQTMAPPSAYAQYPQQVYMHFVLPAAIPHFDRSA
jgi:hypothetical protein